MQNDKNHRAARRENPYGPIKASDFSFLGIMEASRLLMGIAIIWQFGWPGVLFCLGAAAYSMAAVLYE